MRIVKPTARIQTIAAAVFAALIVTAPAFAQAPPPLPPPAQLDNLVSRIALYPDPLLAQVLAAATYPDQIQPAAQYADQHHYLTGDALAAAIQADRLPWDPSVQALIPFPSVLAMMASDMNWTTQLGDAFLDNQQAVMDAVQRERQAAYRYGYLRSNAQIMVTPGPYIAITPVDPWYIPVPYYNPSVVFYAPRRGFGVGAAIGFGFGIRIGPAFRPWGWGGNRFAWDRHEVIINNNRWGRNWNNRRTYAVPYRGVERFNGARAPERHELIPRDAREREAPRSGGQRVEEHNELRGGDRRGGERRGGDRRGNDGRGGDRRGDDRR